MAQTDSLGIQYSDDWKVLQRCPESFSGNYTPAVGTTSIASSAFNKCVKLSGITIPNTVKEIGRNAFTGCKTLTNIYFDGTLLEWLQLKWDGYVEAGYTLWLRDDDEYHASLFPGADSRHISLTKAVIPSSISVIREGAFYYCNSLRQVEFHPNVREIGESAFNKSGVSDVKLPDGLKAIGKFAFLSCKNLDSIYIPDSVSRIGDGPFAYCSNLSSIEVDEENSFYCANEDKNVLYDKFKSRIIQFACKPHYQAERIDIEKTCQAIGYFALVGCGNFHVYFCSSLKEKVAGYKDCKCSFRVPYGTKKEFEDKGLPATQLTELFSYDLLFKKEKDKLDVLTKNPFRILGVVSNASSKEIAANTTKIKRFSAAGKTVHYPTDFEEYLGPVQRDADSIDKALADINLPKDKIKYALFWFVNTDDFDSKTIELLGNPETQEDYYGFIQDNASSDTVHGRINYESSLLLREKEWLEVYLEDLPYFLSKEDFVSQFVSLICGDTYKIDCEEIGHVFIDAILEECDAKQLYLLYSSDSYRNCEEAAEYVKERIIGTYESAINGEIKIARAVARDDSEGNLKAAKNLIARTKTAIAAAKEFLTESDPQYVVLADALAKQILQSGINYYNSSDDYDRPFKAMEIQSYAESLAVGELAKKRCEENTAILRRIINSLPPKSCAAINDEIDALIATSRLTTIDHIMEFLKKGAALIVQIKTLKETEAHTKDEVTHFNDYIQSASTEIAAHALNESIDVVNTFLKNNTGATAVAFIKKAWENMCYIGSLDLQQDFREKRFNPNNKTMGDMYDTATGSSAYGALGLRGKSRPYFSLDLKTETELFAQCQGSLACCNQYLSKYPQGRYVAEVKSYKEEFDWKACKSIDDYKRYLTNYPRGKHYAEAKEKVDDYNRITAEVKAMTSLDALAAAHQRYKGTYFAPIVDDSYYKLCRSKADCQKYMELFPSGKHRSEAKERAEKTHTWLCFILALLTTGLIGGLIAGEEEFWSGFAIGTLGNLCIPVVYLPFMLYSYLIDGPKK